MADITIKSAYLTVKNNKKFLVLGLSNESESSFEVDAKGHKLAHNLRAHGITMDKPVNNTGQFIGQTYKQ